MNINVNTSMLSKRFVAAAATSALVATLGIAVVPAAQAYEPSLRNVNDSVAYNAAKRVPAVESMAGVQELPAGESGTVTLPGTADADSALIRISVFAPVQDVTVTASGIPALFAAAGHDTSATVLVPVSEGTTTLASSAAVDARVEVLATFVGDTTTPGATNAVAQPESRPTTTMGANQTVGIIGLGGLPSTDVRAAYVTADIDLPQAGTVTIAGQRMSLPQGRSVVSTIMLPDQKDGGVTVSSSVGGTVTLTARGWVADAGTNAAQANVIGSYVPTANPEWAETQVTVDKDGAASVPGVTDRVLSIALVSAVKTDDTGLRTFVDAGRHNEGRSEGVLVDDVAGALPQIEVIESPSDSTPVSVRGDAVNVQVLPLGDVLGEPVDNGEVRVDITSPSDDDAIDLAETGVVTITGTVSSDAAIEQIKVYGDSTEIGTADIIYTAEGTEWSMQVAAPDSESVTYTAEAITRDGATAEADVAVDVTLPDEDDIVVSPDTVVVSPDDPANPVLAVNDDDIVFANQPEFELGEVIVSGIGANAPEGFIRRVAAIERTDAGWVVSTTPATLTDAFLQATINQPQELAGDQTIIEEPDDVNADDGIELVNGGAGSVSIVQANAEEPETANITPLARSVQPRSDDDNHLVKIECEAVIWGDDAGDFVGDKGIKLCVDEEEGNKLAERSKGVAFTLEAALKELGIGFDLDIDVEWNWFLPDPTLKYFRVDIHGDYEGEVGVKAFGKIENTYEKQIAKIRTPSVTIPVGPVPVVIKTDVPISFVAEANIEASMQYTYGWARHFAFGKEYKNGEWHNVRDNENAEEPYDKVLCNAEAGFEVESTFEPQAGVKLEPNVKVYDIVGPEISAQLTVGLTEGTVKWNAADGGSLNANVGVKFVGEGKLTVEIPVIDWTLAAITIAHYEHTWDLIELVNKPISGLCQPDNDDDGQDKTQYTISGTVTNAESGEPLSGIDVQIAESPAGDIRFTHTDGDGKFSIELDEGSYTVRVSEEGYIPYEETVDLASDTSLSIALVPPTSSSDEYRAVLTWGERPRDEDSHLIGTDGVSSPYHVYYSDKSAYKDGEEVAWLDVDDTTSYGPETITFDVSPNGTYSYYVHNYSGEADLSSSGAEVRLYRGDQLVKIYEIPTDWADQEVWQVFSIVNGEVVDYVDQPGTLALTSGRMATPPKE